MFRRHKLILIQNQGQPNQRQMDIEILPPTAKTGAIQRYIARPTSLADWGEDGSLRWSLTTDNPVDWHHLWVGRWTNLYNNVTGRADSMYTLGTSSHPRYKIYTYVPSELMVYFYEVTPLTSGYGPLQVGGDYSVYLRRASMTTNGLVPMDSPAYGTGFVNIQSHLFQQGQLTWDRLVN